MAKNIICKEHPIVVFMLYIELLTFKICLFEIEHSDKLFCMQKSLYFRNENLI